MTTPAAPAHGPAHGSAPAPAPSDVTPRRVLPDGRFSGPMPWIIAIMMFLTVLATAAGLAIAHSASALEDAVAGRITVQIVEANPDVRVRTRVAVAAALRRTGGVADVEEIGEDRARAALTPWLGDDGLDADLPVPALIDATVADSSPSAMDALRRSITEIAPTARIDRHADWLGPLAGLFATLMVLAAMLVVLTAAATAAAVILGARAALDQHRATIDVMHLMGATDRQISRLFERRVAQDAISGSALGFVSAVGVLLVLIWRMQPVGAALVSGAALGWVDALVIALLPVAGVALAIMAARLTMLAALARIL